MNILIIDDDAIDRENIKRILSSESYQIEEAETVDEGIKRFYQQDYDVLLLDYKMPKKNGLEMLNEIRLSPAPKETAIIMISTSEEEELALRCIEAGAQDFMVKSEVNAIRLKRAIMLAKTRFVLESKLISSNSQIKKLAEKDSLTGLSNRYHFDEKIKQSLADNNRLFEASLMLIDLDHFKHVNDNQGHDIGDQLLYKFVTRVRRCLDDDMLFARIGGDEFGIFIEGKDSLKRAEEVAKCILLKLEKPFFLNETINTISSSIGLTEYPVQAKTSEEMLKFADIALCAAKKNGRNTYQVFESVMEQQLINQIAVLNELSEAIENDKLSLVYQPIINSKDSSLEGFEALLRWDNLGNKTPDEFIPIAESCGLIHKIGRWVIEEAFQQLSQWNANHTNNYSISINLSPIQLSDSNIVLFISSCLVKYRLRPEWVIFELTETVLLDNMTQKIDVIHQISELNCKIALDDFGTGFSSVSHLRNFPIDVVKIDKSIMPVNDRDTNSLCLINGLESMIHSLELETVAEGVETQLHYDVCCKAGISKIQGKYFDMPLKADEVETKYFNADIKSMVV